MFKRLINFFFSNGLSIWDVWGLFLITGLCAQSMWWALAIIPWIAVGSMVDLATDPGDLED